MSWFRRRIQTIAPAAKVTWNTLSHEEVAQLCAWFAHPGAGVYLRLLASDQDEALRRAAEAAREGHNLKAAVEAAKAQQMTAFPAAQAKAFTLRDSPPDAAPEET